jgi:YrbI family 3-deoxy-D-manno-octulosonate 8-phosphate phosphatase
MIKIVVLDIDGVITDGKVQVDSRGRESKQIDFKDIDAIFELKRKKYKLAIITGENTPINKYFIRRFKPDFFYYSCKDKVSAIKEIQNKTGYLRDEVCFIGDSGYDIYAVKYAGLGVCPNNAVEDVKKIANEVLDSNGGDGCIMELVSLLEKYNNKNH